MVDKDYYEVLGIRPNASKEEIELAYRGRRSQYHPDRYSDKEAREWATGKMKEINVAYSALTDPNSRARFDLERTATENPDSHYGRQSDYDSTYESTPPFQVKNLGEFLRQHRVNAWKREKIYFAPSIPPTKLSAAVSSYGMGLKKEEIVALVDDTVFGGSKEGIIITDREIRFKEIFVDPVEIAIDKIDHLTLDGRSIRANGRKTMRINVPDKDDVQELIEAINEYVDLIRTATTHQGRSRPATSTPADLAEMFRSFRERSTLDMMVEGYGLAGYTPQRQRLISLCMKLISWSQRINGVLNNQAIELTEHQQDILDNDAIEFESLLYTVACATNHLGTILGRDRGIEEAASILMYTVFPYVVFREDLCDIRDIAEMPESQASQIIGKSKIMPEVNNRLGQYLRDLHYNSVPKQIFLECLIDLSDFRMWGNDDTRALESYATALWPVEIGAQEIEQYMVDTNEFVTNLIENYVLTSRHSR